MTRRRLLLIASLPLAVAVVLGVLAMLPRPGVPRANFYGIQRGMTKDEVESILGEPGVEFPWGGVNSFAWRADNGDLVALTFDAKGRMEWDSYFRQETLPEKFRRWLYLD